MLQKNKSFKTQLFSFFASSIVPSIVLMDMNHLLWWRECFCIFIVTIAGAGLEWSQASVHLWLQGVLHTMEQEGQWGKRSNSPHQKTLYTKTYLFCNASLSLSLQGCSFSFNWSAENLIYQHISFCHLLYESLSHKKRGSIAADERQCVQI